MPAACKRRCIHYPCSSFQPCAAHPIAKHRDTKTDDERWFYSSRRWTNFSLRHRLHEPFCRTCLGAGRFTLGKISDHILPIREGGPRWDDGNVQTLCRECDQRKRQQESQRSRKVLAIDDERRRLPLDIPRSRIPITIICGPPGSGKSTYLREHSSPNDLVIDLDQIFQQLSGLPEHQTHAAWLVPALEERNRLLRNLATDTQHERAWFVISLPVILERQIWSEMLGAEVMVLATPLNECIRRIHADPMRAGHRERMIAAAEWWWKQQR